MSLDRRTVLLGLGGAALTGCATPGSALYQVLDAYRALEKGKKEYPISRAAIEGQPLGVLGVQVEGGLKGNVVWSKRENSYDYWRSANGVVIVTQAGRLIRTAGFPQDQLASRVIAGVEPLGSPMLPTLTYEVRRELDFLPDQYGVEAVYQLRFEKNVEVTIMDRPRQLMEWSETVQLVASRRKWRQVIQIDPGTGQVVRSIQHIGPKMRVILEVLKPAYV